MAKYKHGKMNIDEQEKTFAGFVKLTAWVCVVIFGVLIFTALINS